MKRILTALCLSCGLLATQAGLIEPTDPILQIEVTDLRVKTGSLRFSVFNQADGFLRDDRKAVAVGVIKADSTERALAFRLPPGTYAVAILHDENNNGKLDTNFLGIPTEGYGVSNNPKPRFRAPRFREAIFTLPEDGTRSVISLQYL